jgi:uncharacterized delta-60 repeat protein
VRLNADGSVDASFDPGSGANNSVRSFAVQPDGKILVGGLFTEFNGAPRESIVRLNQDGSLDASFAGVDFNFTTVTDIVIQPDGKILVGGNFFSVNGTTRTNIVRLNANGTLDANFNTPFLNTVVYDVALQPNGKIIIGGAFTSPINRIGRLEATGAPDLGFNFGRGIEGFFNGSVTDTVTQPDGKTVIVGNFDIVNGARHPGVARLNADGTLDTSFFLNGTLSGTIRTVALQLDGKIIIGGNFSINQGSVVFGRIARLFPNNGTVDPGFNVISSTGEVNSLAVQPNGLILVAGSFAQIGGAPAGNIARLHPNGSRDPTFNPNAVTNGRINKVLFLPDGNILIGGAFTTVNGTTRSRIARLSYYGTLDETFSLNLSSDVQSLAVQPDGKILIGGISFSFNGVSRGNIIRVNPNGTLDESFDARSLSGASVVDIEVQRNGKILVGQGFSTIGQPVNGVARLNADGTIDTSFNTITNASVFAVELLPGGKIIIGGLFDSVNNAPRIAVARLLNSATARRTTLFDFDGDGKSDVSVFRPTDGTWYLNRSASGFTAANFGLGTDRLTPEDYDGDGKTDIAVFRNGFWFRLNSSTNQYVALHFGQTGDIPVPADYDGDGKADMAVFRNGFWYVLQSSNNQFRAEQFGLSTDKPVPADYDGDGKTDFAVFRNGFWYVHGSQAGFTAVQFGISSDKPVVGDYDGDGKADQAVFREGIWYMQRSSLGFTGMQFGLASDIPTPADYDGDGKTDIAVFRNGNWYIQQSASNFRAIQFGVETDKPIPAAFIP